MLPTQRGHRSASGRFVEKHELALLNKDNYFNCPLNEFRLQFLHRVLGRELSGPEFLPAFNLNRYVGVLWVLKDADRAVGVVGSVFQALPNSGFNRFAASVGRSGTSLQRILIAIASS